MPPDFTQANIKPDFCNTGVYPYNFTHSFVIDGFGVSLMRTAGPSIATEKPEEHCSIWNDLDWSNNSTWETIVS